MNSAFETLTRCYRAIRDVWVYWCDWVGDTGKPSVCMEKGCGPFCAQKVIQHPNTHTHTHTTHYQLKVYIVRVLYNLPCAEHELVRTEGCTKPKQAASPPLPAVGEPHRKESAMDGYRMVLEAVVLVSALLLTLCFICNLDGRKSASGTFGFLGYGLLVATAVAVVIVAVFGGGV